MLCVFCVCVCEYQSSANKTAQCLTGRTCWTLQWNCCTAWTHGRKCEPPGSLEWTHTHTHVPTQDTKISRSCSTPTNAPADLSVFKMCSRSTQNSYRLPDNRTNKNQIITSKTYKIDMKRIFSWQRRWEKWGSDQIQQRSWANPSTLLYF